MRKTCVFATDDQVGMRGVNLRTSSHCLRRSVITSLSSSPRRLVTCAVHSSPLCFIMSARSRRTYLCPASGVVPRAIVRKPTAATGHFIIHHLEVSTIDRIRWSMRREATTLSVALPIPSQSLS